MEVFQLQLGASNDLHGLFGPTHPPHRGGLAAGDAGGWRIFGLHSFGVGRSRKFSDALTASLAK